MVVGMNRDYFAEMYVAGVLADGGWNVYFPRRDQGFDFIVTKLIGDRIVVRPVQVKGKYPTEAKGDRPVYGYAGPLSQVHPDMVLAVPFFATETQAAPMFTAYLPPTQLRRSRSRESWYRVFPAGFSKGTPLRRPSYARFFDAEGVRLMESDAWAALAPVPVTPDEEAESDAATVEGGG